jgi:hypothetical protein
MKNFSDLLDTEHQITVTIKLDVITDNGYPGAQVRLNNDVIEYLELKNSVKHEFVVDLTDSIDLEIAMIDKQYSQHKETAVVIESISIDGFEIVPGWTHLAEYDSERGPQGPTSYLGINGTWRLKIDRPFYQWRHCVTGQGWLLEPISYEDSWES